MRAALRHVALAIACALPLASHAGTFRAYLSVNGNDANACSLGAPCRLLETALNAVNDGGEIWIVDSGNFNLVTANITKSVSIEATPGAIGSIFAIGGPAFNIATPGVKVSLKNLVIRSLAGYGSTYGISIAQAGLVTIDKCTIADLPNGGINADGPSTLIVTDTVLRNNANSGIYLANGVSAVMARLLVSGSTYGVNAQASTAAVTYDLRDSVITRNGVTGVISNGSGTYAMKSAVAGNQITGNGYGVYSGSALGKMSLAGNLIANNTNDGLQAQTGGSTLATDNVISGNGGAGIQFGTGTVTSTGTNTVSKNGTDQSGGSVTTTPKI